MESKTSENDKIAVDTTVSAHSNLVARGTWEVEHWRGGKLLSRTVDKNIITNEGLNAMLDIMLHGSTQITTWYVGIVESNTAAAAGMTYATPTFTESTAYTEAGRQAFVEAAASAQSITNSASKASFTINAAKTIYGAFLAGGGTGAPTKGDTAGGGTLFDYALFASSKPVVALDILNVTVTISLTSS